MSDILDSLMIFWMPKALSIPTSLQFCHLQQPQLVSKVQGGSPYSGCCLWQACHSPGIFNILASLLFRDWPCHMTLPGFVHSTLPPQSGNSHSFKTSARQVLLKLCQVYLRAWEEEHIGSLQLQLLCTEHMEIPKRSLQLYHSGQDILQWCRSHEPMEIPKRCQHSDADLMLNHSWFFRPSWQALQIFNLNHHTNGPGSLSNLKNQGLNCPHFSQDSFFLKLPLSFKHSLSVNLRIAKSSTALQQSSPKTYMVTWSGPSQHPQKVNPNPAKKDCSAQCRKCSLFTGHSALLPALPHCHLNEPAPSPLSRNAI